jgi:hypothetical protein
MSQIDEEYFFNIIKGYIGDDQGTSRYSIVTTAKIKKQKQQLHQKNKRQHQQLQSFHSEKLGEMYRNYDQTMNRTKEAYQTKISLLLDKRQKALDDYNRLKTEYEVYIY